MAPNERKDGTVAGSLQDDSKRPVQMPPGMRVFLEVTDGPDRGKKIEVTHIQTVIGRHEADLTLSDPTVSSRHAVLEIVPEGIFLYDENSTNGTKVNGERITNTQVGNMDEVQVGDTRILLSVVEDKYALYETPREDSEGFSVPSLSDSIIDAGPAVSDTTVATKGLANPEVPSGLIVILEVLSGPDKGKAFRLMHRSNVIGRGPKADIKLSDEAVSQQHVQIEVYQKDKVTVKDLASKNGTMINGRFISAVKLHHGDKIEIGASGLRISIKAD